MKTLLVLGMVLAMVFMFTGCAILPPIPSVCDTAPGESWICTKANDLGVKVEDMDLLISVAILRMDKSVAKKALKFYDAVEVFLSKDVLYRELIDYVRNEVRLTGPEILIVSRYLPYLYSNNYISDFDKGLILAHIDHQRALLQ
ncbi:MAG TPA: hypothetical protein VMW32_07850 [Bacteroidales bacterium]|nr:hypothetical protein [Bacteroidales bacterium]